MVASNQELIALEIHDVSLWEPSRVLPIIKKMEQWGYNTLVLHQNDLLDVCTQLFLATNYGLSDLRLKKVRNNIAWLNKLTERLGQFGAKLFLEIKEPSYHDYVLENYPELLDTNGKPDPLNPSWAKFCEAKTTDLLKRVPNLGGLIVNLSSPESRVSVPDYLSASKDSYNISNWFDEMVSAFFTPLEKSGKSLYIRDFSYTADMQSEVLAAIDRKHGKVGASVKITIHDYFPEFPENPAARTVKSPLIFELEAFGEHTGWGVIPNCRVEELCQRMIGYRQIGAHGMLVRTSWEVISGANAIDTLSAVNIYALPRLINKHIDSKTLVSDWLRQDYKLSKDIIEQLVKLLLESWHIPAAAYWNKKVFPRHSCLPSRWQEGWLSMQTNGMGNSEENISIDSEDPKLTIEAGIKLFEEKEAATKLAHKLAIQAADLRKKLPRELAALFRSFDLLPFFARQFELAIKATYLAASGQKDRANELIELRNKLIGLADEIEIQFEKTSELPHHHQVLISPEQIRLFASSLPCD